MTLRRHQLDGVREAYDAVAESYADLLRTELDGKPLDRALLATFAELVAGRGPGLVGDLGCGPGRITAHLSALGVDVFGVDLSPAMIATARQTYPDLRFDEGRLDALDIEDESLAGIVAWYSIIHTPPEDLDRVFAEFARVLTPGAPLVFAFQVGDASPHHITSAYGHDLDLIAYRLSPDFVTERLAEAGIVVDSTTVREPTPPEKTRQAYLLAHCESQTSHNTARPS